MYRNRLTKETYSNRKEAKITLGASRFNRLFKEKIIYFITNKQTGILKMKIKSK